ncbi:hypothetical protein GLOTRDRAFT_68774 [Gloeophyllum trabeum ATCC 11539]|uniref:Uncharacterized protein n=1 Tax=Gloeophyllum trabeum (strain ATCC 11539 / FP-39264 / Madison 617) TaxID=670483 RepID=S7QML2_GLOTA|nr:uncharacterized protein GLOTRDRAFT_68774 [Gloeophyllum trabeum ATCC 11539]EPQ60806.1 hypothetical protein GLOTRDRAFT_68774 [Gloeophyllum trabeum ATCC 11539]
MGSLCSKSSTHNGGHTVLGSNSSAQVLGGNAPSEQSSRVDPRSAAAQAAERRMKEAQTRGTNASNPNQGRLAAQAEAAARNANKALPSEREDSRLVWD